MTEAIEAARAVTDRPSLIVAHTVIGYGSPHKAGTSAAHGSPLGEEEVKLSKEALGWPADKQVLRPGRGAAGVPQGRGRGQRSTRSSGLPAWPLRDRTTPRTPRSSSTLVSGRLPAGWDERHLPSSRRQMARCRRAVASGKVLNAIAPRLPTLIGGSADLSTSNDTDVEGLPVSFGIEGWAGRNINFGVREHAMGAILNGSTCTAA